MKKLMITETNLKLIHSLCDRGISRMTSAALATFLQKDEDAQEMLEWLETTTETEEQPIIEKASQILVKNSTQE